MTPLTGIGNIIHTARRRLLFARIGLHVALRYAFKLGPAAYVRFLRRAALLLLTFRHNRPVRIKQGYKLQLYLPAYPSPAFFAALENKLLRTPPACTSVVYSMTRACANNCPHCYQKSESGGDLDDAEHLRLFKALRRAGISFFNIEGGEPFLKFERLAALLEAADDKVEIWVNSSGKKVSKEALLSLRARGLAGIMVSIHSPRAEEHDAFTRTPGSFAAACAALRLAGELNLGLAVNSVLSEAALRAGELDDLMRLAKSLGVDYVQLIHPKACGGWLEKRDEMQTDPALLRHIEEQHLLYNSAAYDGYPSLAAQAFEERKAGVGCSAGGIERFYVSAGGEIQPCEFLQLSFGNVRDEDFALIFKRMRAAYARPGTDWQCCTHGTAIAAFMRLKGLTTTPVPWPLSAEFLAGRGGASSGEATALYSKLGIYKS